MAALVGKWKLDKTEKFDEYMQALGMYLYVFYVSYMSKKL